VWVVSYQPCRVLGYPSLPPPFDGSTHCNSTLNQPRVDSYRNQGPIMPSSTATTVQSKSKANGNAANVKAAKGNGEAKAASTPKDDENYEHFFWTYTEEPHRTRRMAIIKAHPEVRHVNCQPPHAATDRTPRSPSYAAQSH
jgi:hypothetical protein